MPQRVLGRALVQEQGHRAVRRIEQRRRVRLRVVEQEQEGRVGAEREHVLRVVARLHPAGHEQHWIGDSTLVFDTVYNPEQTLLLKFARERGCPTVSGVEMFVQQAARQFEIFTGQPAPVEYMAETLRVSTSAAHVIVSPPETAPVLKPKTVLRPIAEPDDDLPPQ